MCDVRDFNRLGHPAKWHSRWHSQQYHKETRGLRVGALQVG